MCVNIMFNIVMPSTSKILQRKLLFYESCSPAWLCLAREFRSIMLPRFFMCPSSTICTGHAMITKLTGIVKSLPQHVGRTSYDNASLRGA